MRRPGLIERHERKRRLAHRLAEPFCWPLDQAEVRVLEQEGHQRPRPLAPGEVPLLSVSKDGRATLWVLARCSPGDMSVVPFVGTAAACLKLAERLATRELPAVGSAPALARTPPDGARWVAQRGAGPDVHLDGDSFGLAFLLAAVSRRLGLAVPCDLAAVGKIDARGDVGRVGGLKKKIEILVDAGKGLRRLLVPWEQRDQADELVQTLGGTLKVIGVRRTETAVKEAWPDVLDRLEEVWRQPGVAARAADGLFWEALYDRATLLDWGGLAAAAGRLERLLTDAGDEDAAWRARIARCIADRHDSRPEPLDLPEERVSRFRPTIRRALVAHAIEGAADAASDGWEEVAAEARHHLGPAGREGPEELRILGALGRLQAAWGRYDRASELLRSALGGWLELRMSSEATRPLCELLRVRGIVGDASEVDELIHGPLHECLADPMTTDLSRGFVALARGRAMAHLGRPEPALALLDGAPGGLDWHLQPNHVAGSRLRWSAWAHRARGDVARAAEVVEELERLAAAQKDDAGFALHLARLDRMLLVGDDPAPGLLGLEGTENDRTDRDRILEFLDLGEAASVERARAVTRHWRY